MNTEPLCLDEGIGDINKGLNKGSGRKLSKKFKNYRYLLIFLTLLILPLVAADRVAVVVDFPDGSSHVECLEATTDTDGYNLLNKLSLSTTWFGPGSFGHQLCKVNNIGDSVTGSGCEFSGQYWRFLTGVNSVWDYMPVGFDAGSSCWNGDLSSFDGHYCVEDGDVVGLSYGEFNDPRPSFKSFKDICNPLTISEVKVSVEGKKESSANEDGGDIEAEPGDEIEFRIELENNYDFDDDLEIENIEAEVTIFDIDDGSNIDENIDFKDLEVGEDDKETLSITIPFVLEDDEYDVELRVTGDTSEGIEQETIIAYKLEIDKEKHDLKFSRLRLDSDETCPNTGNILSLEVANLGENDEDDVRISVKSSDLEIDFNDRFDIEEGDADDTYRIEIPFRAGTLSPGDYSIDLTLDYSDITREDITLTVKDCNQPTITGNVISETVKQPANQKTQATPNNQPVFTESFFQSYAIPILLAIFLLFLIIAIIYIISIL